MHARLSTAVLAFGALVAGCSSAEQSVAPLPSSPRALQAPVTAAEIGNGRVVISQVYGGGGNSGSTLKNDFVELHNTGSTTVLLNGWSLQYASSTGNSWSNRLNLEGSIAPGGYFLVQLAAQGGGTTDLPPFDQSGGINMAGGAGKIALVRTTTQLPAGICPVATDLEDFVGFGSGANCFEGAAPTATLSATNAAIRKDNGCTDTNNNGADFTVAVAAPRNSATPAVLCVAGPSVAVAVAVAPMSIQVGGTATLNATVTQNGQSITPEITWSVAPANVVTLSSTSGASITATGANAGTATVTASALVDGQTYTRTATLTVTAPAGATASISIDRTRPVPLDSVIQLNATARDANGTVIPGMTFTWVTTTPDLVTLSPTGLFTPKATGRALLNVTSADGYTRSGYYIDIAAATGTGALRVFTFRDGEALPLGFQDIVSVQDAATNQSIVTGLTFTSSAPAIVSVETDGTLSAKALGTATITATETSTGRVGSFSVSTVSATAANPSIYGNHVEFGTPVDGTPANDLLLSGRNTFLASYNQQLGQPNWVAYNLDVAHKGSAPRCDCFTHDPLLPQSFTRISSADYLGSGYSRGHMVMSNDRRAAQFDNATTFYFSNIIPQTSANNEGPWLRLEEYLGDQATAGKEVYIVAGGAKYQGTLKNLGNVAIPTWTWKVAVIMGKDQGLAQVDSPDDVTVIAVSMPNTQSMPSGDWNAYRVSVDSVQRLTGYDLLSLLPEHIECRVEQRNCLAEPTLTAPTTTTVGTATTFGVSFGDPDGSVDAPWKVTFNWGDGTSATGTYYTAYAASRPLVRQKAYAAPGTYTVTVTIADKRGAVATTTRQITVN